MRLAFPDESASRCIAAATATAILLLMGKLLLRAPPLPPQTTDQRLRIFFIERTQAPDPVVPPMTLPQAQRRDATAPMGAQTSAPARLAQPPPTPAATPLAGRLYARDGQVRVPAQNAIDPMASTAATNPPGLPNERELERARKLLYPPNPVDYKKTRFDKDWASDGTLGDLAAQKMGRGLEAIAKSIFGDDPQSVAARPPPDVRFNPNLHERAADLGRVETGDAYKAAPIPYEKAPDLKGEASRRIRTAMADLQKRRAGCDNARLQSLMAPVRMHLAALERVEYAMAHGADPVQAEHLLPRNADSAYDQARRALWYADNRLAACGK